MMPESLRVSLHLSRARTYKAPATLTVEQWTATIAHFEGLCAFCREASVSALDHFIPLSRGGGTTVGNCLPACGGCNTAKRDRDGAWLIARFGRDRFESLRDYLGGRSVGPDMIDGAPTAEPIRIDNGRMRQTMFRLPPPTITALDALAASRNDAAGWEKFSRSDLLREAVEKGLAQMREEAKAKK